MATTLNENFQYVEFNNLKSSHSQITLDVEAIQETFLFSAPLGSVERKRNLQRLKKKLPTNQRKTTYKLEPEQEAAGVSDMLTRGLVMKPGG